MGYSENFQSEGYLQREKFLSYCCALLPKNDKMANGRIEMFAIWNPQKVKLIFARVCYAAAPDYDRIKIGLPGWSCDKRRKGSCHGRNGFCAG